MNASAAKLAAYQREARSFARCQAAWEGQSPIDPDDIDDEQLDDDQDFGDILERRRDEFY